MRLGNRFTVRLWNMMGFVLLLQLGHLLHALELVTLGKFYGLALRCGNISHNGKCYVAVISSIAATIENKQAASQEVILYQIQIRSLSCQRIGIYVWKNIITTYFYSL